MGLDGSLSQATYFRGKESRKGVRAAKVQLLVESWMEHGPGGLELTDGNSKGGNLVGWTGWLSLMSLRIEIIGKEHF